MNPAMRVLRIGGATLAVALLGYAIWQGAGDVPSLDPSRAATWGWPGATLALYVLSQVLGASAWRSVLAAHGQTLTGGRAEGQFLAAQIGKYVPGNVGHLVGRYALCRRDGVPGATVGSATAMEIGLLLVSGAVVSAGLLVAMPGFRQVLTEALGAAAGPASILLSAALVGGLVAAQAVLWRRAGRPRLDRGRLGAAALFYAANLFILGASVWCLCRAIPGAAGIGLVEAAAVFAVAWVVGFVVPGAPGGIGVRDGIVALGLGLFMGEGAALAVALSHRLLSGLGDGATFLLGLWLRRATAPADPPAGARDA